MDFNKKIALIAAGSLLSVGGLYAVSTSANAAVTPTAPAITSPIAGADVAEANDVADAAGETESASEGTDQGPDMSASEAGHQDAQGEDDATEGAEVAGE